MYAINVRLMKMVSDFFNLSQRMCYIHQFSTLFYCNISGSIYTKQQYILEFFPTTTRWNVDHCHK